MSKFSKTQKNAILSICFLASMVMISSMTGSLMAYIYKSYPYLPVTTVQLVMALPALIGIFASFSAGPFARKFNKKTLLLVCSASNLFFFLIFALFGVRGPFSLLLFASGLLGIARGASIPLMHLTIRDFLGPDKGAPYIAVTGAVLQAGSATMSFLGGVIGAVNDGANWNMAFYLGLLIVPTVIAFAILMPRNPDAPQPPFSSPNDNAPSDTPDSSLGDRIPFKAYMVGILMVLFFISVSAFLLNISIYIILENNLGNSADVGLVNFTSTGMGVLVGIFYKRLAKTFKDWVMPLCYFMTAVGMAMLIFLNHHIFWSYIAAMLFGLSFSMTVPFNAVYLIKVTPPALVPITVAFVSGSMNLGMFLAPMVLNSLGDMIGSGLNGVFTLSLIIAIFCTIGSVILYTSKPKNAKL